MNIMLCNWKVAKWASDNSTPSQIVAYCVVFRKLIQFQIKETEFCSSKCCSGTSLITQLLKDRKHLGMLFLIVVTSGTVRDYIMLQ